MNVNKDRPSPEWLSSLRKRYPTEREIDRILTRRIERRAGPGYTPLPLQTLIEEPDFSLASFLLSVLGEGTFLNLLSFLERHAPDPVTRQVAVKIAPDVWGFNVRVHTGQGRGHLCHLLCPLS